MPGLCGTRQGRLPATAHRYLIDAASAADRRQTGGGVGFTVRHRCFGPGARQRPDARARWPLSPPTGHRRSRTQDRIHRGPRPAYRDRRMHTTRGIRAMQTVGAIVAKSPGPSTVVRTTVATRDAEHQAFARSGQHGITARSARRWGNAQCLFECGHSGFQRRNAHFQRLGSSTILAAPLRHA